MKTWLNVGSGPRGSGLRPPGIDPAAVRRCLAERPGVAEVHDLHVWPMSTTETALTASYFGQQQHADADEQKNLGQDQRKLERIIGHRSHLILDAAT